MNAVEGDVETSAFLEPAIGPAEVGTYDGRPWGKNRPNVVLFLADTFRADNMAVYGGSPGLTPNLDRLVERSLTFRPRRCTPRTLRLWVNQCSWMGQPKWSMFSYV